MKCHRQFRVLMNFDEECNNQSNFRNVIPPKCLLRLLQLQGLSPPHQTESLSHQPLSHCIAHSLCDTGLWCHILQSHSVLHSEHMSLMSYTEVSQCIAHMSVMLPYHTINWCLIVYCISALHSHKAPWCHTAMSKTEVCQETILISDRLEPISHCCPFLQSVSAKMPVV